MRRARRSRPCGPGAKQRPAARARRAKVHGTPLEILDQYILWMGQQNPSPDDTLDGLSNYLKGFLTSKVVQDFETIHSINI